MQIEIEVLIEMRANWFERYVHPIAELFAVDDANHVWWDSNLEFAVIGEANYKRRGR
jgi:hypothetical protein